ncbi:ABC transporter permease [Sporolactobacillus pectinivorans]|uniref:ABC transporter permease n=1 Tax=Sporolactobacillus pectinivorans TaxID=1591408 RepID=UPI001EFD99DA|nr:ABC transporter permease [Sporolactobacillus pectinivorans]
MANFLGLVQNENMKIYRRGSAKVFAIILIGLLLLGALVVKLNEPSHPAKDTHWQQSLRQQNTQYQQALTQMKKNDSYQNYYKSQIAINQYRIDHNLQPAQRMTLWSFVANSTSMMVLVISIFTIIVVSNSIASEFNTGTIKLLMIRPISRTEILLSKYISSLLFSIMCLVVLFIFSWLIGGLFFGFSGANEVHLSYTNGVVHESSWILATWGNYLLDGVQLIMMVTLAGVISAIFRNGGLAIGLTIFLMMGSNTILAFISQYDWVKYVLFTNLDLNQYYNGQQMRNDMSLGFSLIVLAAYYLIFAVAGWLFYTKRDIKA